MKIFYTIVISLLAIIFFIFIYSFIYRVFIAPPVTSEIVIPDVESNKTQTIQIEIMNGTNVNNLAKKMMDWLRDRNFDVINVGNWSADTIQTTVIYDRLGNLQASKFVAEALGVPDSLVFNMPDSSLILNTTIIIGYDYKRLNPFK